MDWLNGRRDRVRELISELDGYVKDFFKKIKKGIKRQKNNG